MKDETKIKLFILIVATLSGLMFLTGVVVWQHDDGPLKPAQQKSIP